MSEQSHHVRIDLHRRSAPTEDAFVAFLALRTRFGPGTEAGAATGPGADDGVVGADLDWTPYLSWLTLRAGWAHHRPTGPLTWHSVPTAERLGATLTSLAEAYRDQTDGTEHGATLRAALDDTVLFELWLTAYATGTVSGLSVDEIHRRSADPLVRAAARTALPGGFRRYLAPGVRDLLAGAGAELVLRATAAGADAGPGG